MSHRLVTAEGLDSLSRFLSRRCRATLVAMVFASVQSVLLLHTALDKSDVIDESTHIGAAALLWAHGDFRTNREAPVLPKWGFALAIRLVDPTLSRAPRDHLAAIDHTLWSKPFPTMRRNLVAARIATVAVVVAGGLFLWLAARRFGEATALCTHTLWCFSPSILAHGSLATLDGWAAALVCVAIWATVRLVERPTLLRWVQAGAVSALAAACKITTLGVLPVIAFAGVAALRTEERRASDSKESSRRTVASLLVFLLAMVLTLWAIYGFEVDVVSLKNPYGEAQPTQSVGNGSVGPVPAAAWVEGALFQWSHGAAGHKSYLFGEIRHTGWWWFYLACLALKVTIGTQLLALLRAILIVAAPPARQRAAVDALVIAFPLLLFVVMSAGKAQAGIKYILPAFPFAMLWTGRVVCDAERVLARWGIALVLGLLAASIADSLRVHPHHLMYFNAWAGGPEGGPRYLVVGDDWCQDQRRLGEWQRARGIARIYYTFCGGRPDRWGIVYEKPPCEPSPGIYALHAVEAHRPDWTPPGCLDWLTVAPPDERIGHSIYIYYVDRKRSSKLRAGDRGHGLPGLGPARSVSRSGEGRITRGVGEVSSEPVLSIVVPCDNEEGNIEELRCRTLGVLDRHGLQAGMLLMGDGSRDETREAIQAAARKHPEVRGLYHDDLGIAAAWRTSLEAAHGRSARG